MPETNIVTININNKNNYPMKQIKLTFVLTLLMSMVGLQAFAAWNTYTEVRVGDLYYHLDYDYPQAQVTSMPFGGKYNGYITIPSAFNYQGNTYSVTSIGDGAFNNCSGLISITIPNSVTSIGRNAFIDCNGLTTVTIGNSVTSIDEYAFTGCNRLTKVIINDIAAWFGISFADETSNPLYYSHHLYSDKNTEITNLVIPDGVTSIGNYAFWGCSGITSVTIPNSVTSIGENAFGDCFGLASVTLNSNYIVSTNTSSKTLKSIFGEQVVEYIIGDDVTSIGRSAFWGCTRLTSVTIGSGVTSIGDYAFIYCYGLTSVNIPNSVTSIGSRAFNNCSGLKKVIVSDIAAWFGISFADETSNPLYYSHHLYSDENTEITNLVIPDGVTSIGEYAFYNCSGLTSITIPNSVTSIGNSAFRNCSGLTSITIPNSVTSIGSGAFSECSGLTSVTIPNSVTSIGDAAFSGCSGLTSVMVESGNTKYDSRNNCNAIIETASNKLIAGCKNTIIPNSVTSIGGSAFSGCTGLTSVIIPSSVTSIGDYAFFGCSGLTSVTIPNSVTSIGKYAFYNCYGLTSITIPNSVTSIGQLAFYGCTGLTSITIPNSVTSISEGAFEYCSGLTSITIPNSVTSIGDLTFYGCSGLTSVIIPNSVTSIGYGAFQSSGLTSVTALNPTPIAINLGTFTNQRNATLYVPQGSKEAYQAADCWKEFKEIIEIIEIDPGDANGDGEVNITDITYIIDKINDMPAANFNEKAADLNGDGEINITDVTLLLDIINGVK